MTDNQSTEIRSLKMQVAKLQLESKLRRNLASEIDKQKQLARNAEEIAKEKSREIEEIASQLSKYLSPQLFASIFSGEKKVIIQSEKKFLTVFFSDIVSFTSISDNMDSVPLTEMLNIYLTKMSEIALKYGGTIDKYIGDSVMIFFGDPETAGKNNDALNCVKMAIEMQNTMKKLSIELMNDFNLSSPLKIRVGINSGECTVGNFGSETRLDYTVIGGTVNLAARLESSAKQYGVYIQLSDSTYEAVKDQVVVRALDFVRVMGKTEPVKVFELISEKGQEPEPYKKILPIFHEGLENYFKQDWDKAIEAFKTADELEEMFPGRKTNPSRIYIPRCQNFKANPPGDDWDGVWTQTSK